MNEKNFKPLKIIEENQNNAKNNIVKENEFPLNEKENSFCEKFLKTGNGFSLFLKLFPEEKNFCKATQKCHFYRFLNKKRIQNRLNELKALRDSTLAYSLDLNKRKLLEKAITMLEECDNKAERGHAVNILKMLFQKEGMLQQNNNTINVNIANNTVVNDVSKFLDL